MKINFQKDPDGLVPAIIQDANTLDVLMLGYMNTQAFDKTEKTGLVTFYSRSRKILWTKGETSGNYLKLVSITADCDSDTLLVKALPTGPVCHTGNDTCFSRENSGSFLYQLEHIVNQRKDADPDSTYTAKLFKKGIKKIAQKVGEEAVETVIEAVAGNKAKMIEEGADLLYHLLVLLAKMDLSLSDISSELRRRHQQ